MKIESSKDDIIFLRADTQYELCSTFWRLQEYYESPKFRGQFFGIEEYMDWYAEEYGNFTYFSDWNGFNVPGDVVREFFAGKEDLFEKEKAMYELLKPWIEGDQHSSFYVIGIWKADNTLDHEFSHAFYHLDTSYKAQQTHAMQSVPKEFVGRVHNWLEEKGYHESVFKDEAIAYLATNTMADMLHDYEEPIPWSDIAVLQVNFSKRYETYNGEKNEAR